MQDNNELWNDQKKWEIVQQNIGTDALRLGRVHSCWLLPDLAEDLLLLPDGVDLLHPLEGVDLLRISQKVLTSGDAVAKWAVGVWGEGSRAGEE